jgi:eukaryotic-like serine/threonine-protein kinase
VRCTAHATAGSGALKAANPAPFFTSPAQDWGAAFSPSGKWIAYQSNKSGRFEVYVRPFPAAAPGREQEIPVSNNGGTIPIWVPRAARTGVDDGRGELLYQEGRQIMSVRFTVRDGAFLGEKAQVRATVPGLTGFDIAPDGRRLAVVRPTATREAPFLDRNVVLVQHYRDEFRRRAPSRRDR